MATGPTAVVREFLRALEDLDVDRAMTYTAPEVVYQNVPLQPARGHDAVRRQLCTMARYGTGFRAEVHNIASNRGVVLTERTDTLEVGPWQVKIWVCGTFEVSDGQITLWRDYFDWSTLLVAGVRGALQAAGAAASRRLTKPATRTRRERAD